MLNREQWEALARFAGVDGRVYMRGFWVPDAEYNDDIGRRWCPDSAWNDFGPLWRLLKKWMNSSRHVWANDVFIYNHMTAFDIAAMKGTESELMQPAVFWALLSARRWGISDG